MELKFYKFLIETFESKKINNPNYSLRALARDLEIEPSLLSKLIRKKVNVTNEMIVRISTKLNLSNEAILNFINDNNSNADKPFKTLQVIPLDEQQLIKIQDSLFTLIIELTKTKNFRNDDQWIATTLSTNVESVIESKKLLRDLGLILEEDEHSLKIKNLNGYHFVPKDKSAINIDQLITDFRVSDSKIQHEHFKNVSIVEEDFYLNLIIAVDESVQNHIRKELREFVETLNNKIQKLQKTPTTVYKINFSMTKKVRSL